MKISQLISKLQILQEKHGDNDLRFTAKDAFSRYGEEISIDLRVGDTTGLPSDWNDVASNGSGTTTLLFCINHKDGKSPKITFRK